MENVLVTIANDALVFSRYQKAVLQEKLFDTNVISNDELVFSYSYLEKNKRIVSLFLTDLIKDRGITKIIIETYEIANKTIDIINMLAAIKKLYLAEETSLPFMLCEKIVDNKTLEHLNCYSVPPYMLEILDRSNLFVETRNEVLFTSKFMAVNNLSQYSKIYYKTNIRIEEVFNTLDNDDFDTFCKVNRYLKVIHLYFVDLDFLEMLVLKLHELRIKNIKIYIHKNITDKEIISKLKALNTEYKNKYSVSLKVIYSETYLKENIFGQVIVNFLKTVSVVVIIVAVAVFGTILFNNHLSLKKVEAIGEELKIIIDKTPETPLEENPTNEKTISNKFIALLDVNDETVGWLTVNNTKIDYPIVQGSDNSFYLTKDYYKNNDFNGWVFMDYRNSIENLNKNTILYGHNRYYSGVIFGTLNNVLKKSWYENKENQIIRYNTLYEELEWQIFSIYRIENTNDYIKTSFKTDEDFSEFLEMIKERSINNFKVDITKEDKILTLSTCLDNDRRLVVHAKLITKTDSIPVDTNE